MVRVSYDEIDIKILELLKKNSRMSFVEIGKKLNLSEGAIRKRVKKLEKIGILKRCTVDINYKMLGIKLAIIGIDTDPDAIFEVANKIKKFGKNVEKVYISFGDHNILVFFYYLKNNELEDFLKFIGKIEGVMKICPTILIEEV